MTQTPSRKLSSDDAKGLRPGDDHYMAYVGPPAQYDFMGATQFRLLTALGLRAFHRVLDVGCGSLRAGRLLIPYLDRGRYFGIEPNTWLVDEAIERELGRDLVRIKQPRFDANDRFQADVFRERFDFIVAQSIFSHTAGDLATDALAGLREVLAPGGVIACTFVESPSSERATHAAGWTYPGCVRFAREEVAGFFSAAGLQWRRLGWFHPRQAWYLGATTQADLPADEHLHHLSGAVLRSPEFADSLRERGP